MPITFRNLLTVLDRLGPTDLRLNPLPNDTEFKDPKEKAFENNVRRGQTAGHQQIFMSCIALCLSIILIWNLHDGFFPQFGQM